MIQAEYRYIGPAIVEDLVEAIGRGETSVILGPYFGGKTYLLERVRDALQFGRKPIWLQFYSDSPIVDEIVLRHKVAAAAADIKSGAANLDDQSLIGDLLATIPKGDRAVLLISSLDGIGQPLLRRFVAEILQAAAKKQLVAVMTGELDAAELVAGSNPQIRNGRLFVLQGLDRGEFGRFVTKLSARFTVEIQSDDAMEALWSITGGSASLATRFVREISLRLLGDRALKISPDDILRHSDLELERGTSGAPILLRATNLISAYPSCWKELESLVRNDVAPAEGGLPSILEMAGVAVRDNRSLRCRSSLISRFLGNYYDDRKFGDLYASDSQWDRAITYYRRSPETEPARSARGNDLTWLRSVVNAVCSQMHALPGEIHKDEGGVKRDPLKRVSDLHHFFADACRFVLALQQVTFWTQLPTGTWAVNKLGIDTQLPLEALGEVVIQYAGRTSGDLVACSPSGLLGTLAGFRDNQRSAVLISGLNHSIHVPREQMQLIRHLLSHFIQAHEHAVAAAKMADRRQLARAYAASLDSIQRGPDSRTVESMVTRLADSWHRLVFGRVLISLVNATSTEIDLIHEAKDPEWTSLGAAFGKGDLSIGTSDGVLNEALGGKPVICEYPIRDGRLPLHVQKIGLGPFVVVPMMNSRRSAMGAIILERRDRSLPTNSELIEISFLVDQLTLAIEASERTRRLQFALDSIPEATLIVDENLKTEYASEPAADLFGIKSGWRPDGRETNDLETLPGLRDAALRSLYGAMVMRYDEDLGTQKWAAETIAIGIRNTRGQPVGSLLHFRNYSPLRRTVNALGRIASAESIKEAKLMLLGAAKELGFKWGRLYSPLAEDTDVFASEECFGLSPKQAQLVLARHIKLPRRNTPSNASWLCIEQEKPLLFCYLPDRSYGTALTTKYGLDYVTVDRINFEDEIPKRPGDFWIDLPLRTTLAVIGKVTLGCDENMLPEEFRLLQQLADLYPRIVDSIASKERMALSHTKQLRADTSRDTLNAVVHTLRNVLQPLTNITFDYERHGDNPEIAQLNARLRNRVATGLATVERLFRAFGRSTVRPKEHCDLIAVIRSALAAKEKDAIVVVTSELPTLNVRIDPHGFAAVFAELIQNSLDAVPVDVHPKIEVIVSVFQKSRREYVRLVYTDNGPGIPREFKEAAFKEFETLANRGGRRRYGSGIGLAVVRRIVEDEHEGFVKEVGEPGDGVKFIFEFPRDVGGTEPQ